MDLLDPVSHPDLPGPWPRSAPRHSDSLGRCSVFHLRRASGLHPANRIQLQTERDALLHRLDHLDEKLLGLTAERRGIVDHLTQLRERLYPPVPWAKGRRPPAIDRAPLPPATEGSQSLGGRDLRLAALTILRRHGILPLRELHALLHRYGYVIASRKPVAALSDAMAHEVEHGRAVRVERGVYQAVEHPHRRRQARVPIGDQPAPWPEVGPSPLDPDADEDPSTWSALQADVVGSEGHH